MVFIYSSSLEFHFKRYSVNNLVINNYCNFHASGLNLLWLITEIFFDYKHLLSEIRAVSGLRTVVLQLVKHVRPGRHTSRNEKFWKFSISMPEATFKISAKMENEFEIKFQYQLMRNSAFFYFRIDCFNFKGLTKGLLPRSGKIKIIKMKRYNFDSISKFLLKYFSIIWLKYLMTAIELWFIWAQSSCHFTSNRCKFNSRSAPA